MLLFEPKFVRVLDSDDPLGLVDIMRKDVERRRLADARRAGEDDIELGPVSPR